MNYKKFSPFLIIVILGFIPLLDLFHQGFPVTHDGQDHIARITNFYKNLEEGNLIPRWASNLNWGYGHPILMFLYPLPSYAASMFHFLSFSFIDSLKIVFGASFILSGLAMFLWVRNFWGNNAAILSAVLYMFAPYRFVDLYVRGAIGEHVAFMFPPLVLYFLLKLSKKYSSLYVAGGSLSLAGFILSHNAISLMFLPFIIFYAGYLIYLSKQKKHLAINTFFIILLGFGISAFFWIPALLEGRYTLREIVTKGEYFKHFIDPKMLVYSPWNYGQSKEFTLQIGFVNLFSLIFSIVSSIILFKKKKNVILIFTVLYSLSAIFIMTSYSDFIWRKFLILQNFQFPWRFLSVIVFTTAVLGGFLLKDILKNFKKTGLIILVAVSIFLTKDYWHAKSYLQKPENYFTGVYYGTTDTGESAPRWSVRFMEKTPKTNMEIIDGKAQITEVERNSTNHKYKIVAQDKTRVRENTLYFPGWNVYVNGSPVNIEFQDPKNRGLITFFVDKGQNIVNIEFRDTKLRKVSNLLTLISLFTLAIYSFSYSKIIKWKS